MEKPKYKPRYRSNTGAKVTITIELSNLGSWGPDCTTGQVYDQALEAAIGRLNRAFKDDLKGIKLIGNVKVESISTDTEKR